jgi:hypothetical protein
MPLPIQKSAAKSLADAVSEIDNQELCCCRSRNRQALLLPILKAAAKYCAAADLEIRSLKLCRCRFRNRQLKAFLLPVLKAAAKYCAAADPEIDSDGGVILDSLASLQAMEGCICALRGSQTNPGARSTKEVEY